MVREMRGKQLRPEAGASDATACILRSGVFVHAVNGRQRRKRNYMISKRSMQKIWLCSAPALLGSAMLIAQSNPGGGAPQQPSSPNQQPTTGAAPVPGAEVGAPPTAQNMGDQAFVSQAMEGGVAEVQLGQLAQEKSQSSDVQQFGKKMVSDHTQMGEKWLKPVAKQMGVNEPKGPSKKDKKLIEKLQGLSGPQFDTEYIQAMLKDHKKDLKDFQNETQMAQDPTVKQIAQQGSNIIQQHLQLIEQIAQAHNVPVDGKKEASNK
jgi:putative membrane protein